jgi:hypothetical protein
MYYTPIDHKYIITNISIHPSFVKDVYNIIYLIKLKCV